MKSIIAIALAIVLGIASLGLSQPDTLANAVSFLLDLINVQSEQIDQIRIEAAAQEDSIGELYDLYQSWNPDAVNDEINDLWNQVDELAARLNDLEVQTPSSK